MPAILLCRSGDDAGLAHPIIEARCLIGRGSECSLSLLHPQLSREHAAVVHLETGGFEVEDLHSHNGTQLNVTPTSNVMLSRVETIGVHPIRALYDNGVRVTVNSDDVAIFDQGVSDEFLALYEAGLFTAAELDEVRQDGLRQEG